MITRFRSLFTLAVTHSYYTGVCPDFQFVFPQDAVRLLQDTKLLAKEQPGQLTVLSETDSGGQPRVPLTGRKLRLGLKLLNPFFSNITATTFEPPAVTPLYRNAASPLALDAPLRVSLVGGVSSHALGSPARPVQVSLKDAAGREWLQETVTLAADTAAVSLQLAGLPAGAYTLLETYPGESRQKSYYIDPEMLHRGIFGMVEIDLAPAFVAAAPTFTLSFQARQQVLKYYVVANKYNAADFGTLNVTDAGFGDDGRPQVAFQRVDAANFLPTDITPALLATGEAKVVLFRSNEALPRRDKARRKIQLSQNNTVLIPHLPQPGPDQATGEIIIHLSKP